MTLHQTIEAYHSAVDAFARGDASPAKQLCAHSDDVLLANPFGPAVRGWSRVSQALDAASSTFREGRVDRFERLVEFASGDLAIIFEVERWNAKVRGRDQLTPFTLRVTTTFRREHDEWKMVHRHADPIADAHPDGPLRATGA